MRYSHPLLVIFLVASQACTHPLQVPAARRNIITQQEIAASNATTAYDVIARLRGEFLRDRGPTSLLLPSQNRPVVFLQDHEYGAVETLREFRSSDLAEIRFYTGSEAVTKFGTQYSGGVIQLVPRVQ